MDGSQLRAYAADMGRASAQRRRVAARVGMVHRRILREFATTGGGPAAATVEQWAREAGVDAGQALACLVERDLVEVDPHTGVIGGAYPFSSRPRGHRVDIVGGSAVQAYCAVDALGVPAMLHRDVVISSRDPHGGSLIRVRVAGGIATWAPDGVVVSVPAVDGAGAGDQPAVDCACPMVNFYASAENARDYRQVHRVGLEILTIPEALVLASAVFGSFLDHGDGPARGDRPATGGVTA